ncbi:hypothetical protein [Commensalibacter nepenthis]|uniref:Lipoprotein n=1 Tax=Commensalibacter nepenthis TaxID=3043872 RepID=A0ABT6Q748_9PROT|nr:hypothetical protein [Commensalibacter sp. TBRC 10068]MDI2112068.1 hypothetical protein [Commensalibacter sp. TBRC 10068]
MLKSMIGIKCLVGMFILPLLGGCSDEAPPACKSEQAEQLIQSVYEDAIHNQLKSWSNIEQSRERIFSKKEFPSAPAIMTIDLTYHAKMKPSFVKEITYDKESKIRTCSATVSAMADKTILDQYMEKIPQEYFAKDKQEIQNILLNKGIFDNDIRYELQNTDDGKVQIKIQGMRL